MSHLNTNAVRLLRIHIRMLANKVVYLADMINFWSAKDPEVGRRLERITAEVAELVRYVDRRAEQDGR